RSENGIFNVNQNAPPVVEFSVRQGVVHGLMLWLPFGGLLSVGLLLLCVSLWLRSRFAVHEVDGPVAHEPEQRPRVQARRPQQEDAAESPGVSALRRGYDRSRQGRGKRR